MIRWIRDWLAGRRAREERRAYVLGYNWAADHLAHAPHDMAAIRATRGDTLSVDAWERAFDRGARAACDDPEAAVRRLDALVDCTITTEVLNHVSEGHTTRRATP